MATLAPSSGTPSSRETYCASSPVIASDGTVIVGTKKGIYAIAGSSPLACSAWPMIYHDQQHRCRKDSTLINGLVAWWSADVQAYDIIANKADVLLSSASTVSSGKVGKAFSFDGINGHVRCRNRPEFSLDEVTLEAWINPAATNTWMDIISKWDYVNDNQCCYMMLLGPSNHLWAAVSSDGTGGNGIPVSGTIGIPTNQWTHVAATYDGSHLRIYVNGTLDGTADGDCLPIFAGTNDIGIGATVTGHTWGETDEPFKGKIDEPTIFRRALPASEIAGIVAAGTSGKCVGYVVDSDNDGLPDAWEYKYFGTLSQGPTGDHDSDGQNNLTELQNGTDP